MRACLVVCVAALSLGATTETMAWSKPRLQIPSFPGAEGAGRLSPGGRAGQVLKVTNLNDAGSGSLRAAIEATGARTVVFDVSGTIELVTPLTIRESNITIAGQTAPGDGISIRNQPLFIEADNVIIRYIRARLGTEGRAESDVSWLQSDRGIVLDHVVVDSLEETGDRPELKSLSPFLDGDNDGMPDHWERANGLNLAADDSATDNNKNGYTNLEEYLNELVLPRPVPRIT
ncbi:MAG: hypothetical protein ABUL42_01455, partial [Terricaulis silvestris]